MITYQTGSLLPEILMILFTQSTTAVLHKYLNDDLKILCLLLHFSLRLHRIP